MIDWIKVGSYNFWTIVTTNMKMILMMALILIPNQVLPAEPPKKPTFEQYLERSVVSRKVIDVFLRGPSWVQFDPELGYIPRNYNYRELERINHSTVPLLLGGINHSATVSTVQANGARTSFMYAGRKPRINTYGDSMTQSMQVSDGETWQEYLAGHLGEPIGNFGVGGYGVYQAYRRMIRSEKSDHSAEYLILYICCDDATRSLYRSRHAAFYMDLVDHNLPEIGTFHGNFWAHVEMDLKTGRFVEKENLLPTAESLYHMTEPGWMVRHLKDDLALELFAYAKGFIRSLDREQITQLSKWLDFSFDWGQSESALRSQAASLLRRYSNRATGFILDKARTFADQNRKKLLIVLFDPWSAIEKMKQASATGFDQELLDYLVKRKFNYFDMNDAYIRYIRKYRLSEEFVKQYHVNGSHYSPQGNHLFAYLIKDKVVQWLDPKPIPYRQLNPQPK